MRRRSYSLRGDGPRGGEGGYALAGLLALMTVLMLSMMAAAPSARQQGRREREAEAIRRGEEVAEAIRLYMHYRGGQLPTSVGQLLEGIPVGTKKVYVLRASAARDPLTAGGDWRLVGLSDAPLVRFQRDVLKYAGGRLPPTRDQMLQPYASRLAGVQLAPDPGDGSGGGDDSAFEGRPGNFIGVASRSRGRSVLRYYGIERHDRWVFTPLFR